MGNFVDYTRNSALMWGVQVTESNQTPCALSIKDLVFPHYARPTSPSASVPVQPAPVTQDSTHNNPI